VSLALIALLGGGSVAGFTLSGFSAIPGLFAGTIVNTVGRVDFVRPLAVPRRAESTVDASGIRTFSLAARAGSTEFIAGARTPTWGFNQSYLGPTLVAERGETVAVKVTNGVDEATTVHWHGMHLPPSMDGGPHQLVAPGETWTPQWTIDQPAATLWYHPHPHGSTDEQMAKGLLGLFLLTDPLERALDLPRDYGVDDVPVVVQDIRFGEAGEFDRRGGFVGALGDQLLVNGTLAPYFQVTTTSTRLRLLNASTARTYDFAFGDSREFDQIASDGGLLEAPRTTSHVRLSPGERAEIVVTMNPSESVILRSQPPKLGDIVPFGGPDGSRDRFDVLQLRAASTLRAGASVPARLVPAEPLDEAASTAQRSFVLDGTTINGRVMSLARIDETVIVGSTEIWTVTNEMARPHNFHIHDVQFRVLTVGGAPPPPELGGSKDTVYLEPNVEYRLIMRFDDYTDRAIPYMFHCHLLQHEDSGMMGQFVVVRPGESAARVPGVAHTH
jgi:FtsP/CotA-like multicopper oxidase with cupredoxin domain